MGSVVLLKHDSSVLENTLTVMVGKDALDSLVGNNFSNHGLPINCAMKSGSGGGGGGGVGKRGGGGGVGGGVGVFAFFGATSFSILRGTMTRVGRGGGGVGGGDGLNDLGVSSSAVSAACSLSLRLVETSATASSTSWTFSAISLNCFGDNTMGFHCCAII